LNKRKKYDPRKAIRAAKSKEKKEFKSALPEGLTRKKSVQEEIEPPKLNKLNRAKSARRQVPQEEPEK